MSEKRDDREVLCYDRHTVQASTPSHQRLERAEGPVLAGVAVINTYPTGGETISVTLYCSEPRNHLALHSSAASERTLDEAYDRETGRVSW